MREGALADEGEAFDEDVVGYYCWWGGGGEEVIAEFWDEGWGGRALFEELDEGAVERGGRGGGGEVGEWGEVGGEPGDGGGFEAGGVGAWVRLGVGVGVRVGVCRGVGVGGFVVVGGDVAEGSFKEVDFFGDGFFRPWGGMVGVLVVALTL